ncbi:Uncharacterised protein [Streptococcus pneumoniae]|nr:Uncharacterised protein [Streptococcus pneumoniae]
MITNSTIVIIAAGNTIKKFVLNLSFISVPCERTAAIVVSEINDKLSPNIAPPTTVAIVSAIEISVCPLIPTAIGANAAIVPMEVPIANEINAPITKMPATINPCGKIDNAKLTVESTPPIPFAVSENAPASTKIRTIIIISGFPAPLANRSTFTLKLSLRFIAKATPTAIEIATSIGNL